MANEIWNNCGQGNFIANNSIFILDIFAVKTTSEVLGRLHNMIYSLPQTEIYTQSGRLTSPYDVSKIKNPIIDVYIASNGGDGNILHSLSCLFGLAKSRGAIIRTTVLSNAESCGSLLAIQGTPGFRIMYSAGYHFIHFGTHRINVRNESEIEAAAQNIRQNSTITNNLYLKHTKLTAEQLKKLQSNEQGILTAQQCLKHGLCDWILDECGNINKKQR